MEKFFNLLVVLAVTVGWQGSGVAEELVMAPQRPNVVLVLADDLGFGDIEPNNPSSGIPTPAFNRLAREGMRFTDAHTGSSVCTPTRYGLLCGRYAWRTRLKKGVLNGYSEPLIDGGQPTVADLLQSVGYRTACIGKWHLGLGWRSKSELPKNAVHFRDKKDAWVDFSQPVDDGPREHGFDYSYIIPASLDMSPYVYLENGSATSVPEKVIEKRGFPEFLRRGEVSEDFDHRASLSHLLNKADEFICQSAKGGRPFFLYFPMPAPHKPVIPMEQFQGKTELGPYGDFVAQVDWTVGGIIDALDRAGVAENTLLLVTSDNGSFMKRVPQVSSISDHVDDDSVQGYLPSHHQANGIFRGTKADIYEAGHRVPFLVRWPGKIKSGVSNSSVVCLTDILATVCEAADVVVDSTQSEDSFSFLPSALALPDRVYHRKRAVIHHSAAGVFAIRKGNWKLILGNGSGGREMPKGKPFQRPFQLYNLSSDPEEQCELLKENPETALQLEREFAVILGEENPIPDFNQGQDKD
ncbi:MAG: sulfatase family protein [Mariniblastus sp.]